MSLRTEISTNSKTIRMSWFCAEHGVFRMQDGIWRLPFLIKGRLRVPPEISRAEIEAAFADLDARRTPGRAEDSFLVVGQAQVLRERVVDRATMRRQDEWIYSVMPTFRPQEVIEGPSSALVNELYNLPFGEVLKFVKTVGRTLEENADFVTQVCEETLRTATLPDVWHEAGFAAFPFLLDEKMIAQMVDQDLRAWGIRGRDLLDGWQTLPDAEISPEPIQILMEFVDPHAGSAWRKRRAELRAMPTRQLHITAGNSPQIPLVSLVRALATKSAAVVKLPFGATAPGALIALAAAMVLPEHPLTKHLSVVYWPGGDRRYEDVFFQPKSFDRIVVWGSPSAVMSVKERAPFSKVVAFNPRFGLSLIGREAFASESSLHEVAVRAITDSLVANQKACIASQVHFVEGSPEQVRLLARKLQDLLRGFDAQVPNYVEPSTKGDLRRLQNGTLWGADWYVNQVNGEFSSGVVVVENEFNLAQHPMCRLLILRPVRDLREVLPNLSHAVSTVSLFPEERKNILRDEIAAAGVSNILNLGESGSAFAGQSHDGMMVLAELVDWKNS